MRAFDVSLNGKKLCRAGIGDDGVLTTIVDWVTGKGRADLKLHVGGLRCPADEYIRWVHQKPLHVRDRIQIKLVEATSVDKPSKVYRLDPKEDLKNQKRYVRLMARKFGWKILARPK